MTSRLLKYLNEQLGVFLNVKQLMKLAKNMEKGFLSKNFFLVLWNTYAIKVFENFLRSPLKSLLL